MGRQRRAQAVRRQIPICSFCKHELRRLARRKPAGAFLFAQVEKRQQKNPKSIHEMPIVRSDFRSRRKGNFCFFKFAEGNKKQGADASQEMDCVRAGENVKETAGLVARDVHALRDKLPPGNELPGDKEKSQDRGRQPKFTKAGKVRKKEPPPRRFQSKTAREKNERVGPENARKMDGHPQIVAATQDDEGAGKRHEKHQNGNDADRDCSRVAFGRRRRLVAAMAVFAATVAIIASSWRWRRAAASTADVFDD